MALLSPITIFYRPKKKIVDETSEHTPEQIDPETPSQVKSTETDIPSQTK